MPRQPPGSAVEIAPGDLSPQALRGLVEEFVTRDGTDYGAVELGLEEKCARLMAQLRSGEARILFDPESETTQVVAERSVRDSGRQAE